MKKLIILILILFFYSCTNNCERYYFYSDQHLKEQNQLGYSPNYIYNRCYTGTGTTEAEFEIYKQYWPDAKITYIACIDTIK